MKNGLKAVGLILAISLCISAWGMKNFKIIKDEEDDFFKEGDVPTIPKRLWDSIEVSLGKDIRAKKAAVERQMNELKREAEDRKKDGPWKRMYRMDTSSFVVCELSGIKKGAQWLLSKEAVEFQQKQVENLNQLYKKSGHIRLFIVGKKIWEDAKRALETRLKELI